MKNLKDIIDSIDQAKQNIEAIVKPIEHIKKKVLIDIALLSHPDNGNIITSAIKKEVTTNLLGQVASNPPCICL